MDFFRSVDWLAFGLESLTSLPPVGFDMMDEKPLSPFYLHSLKSVGAEFHYGKKAGLHNPEVAFQFRGQSLSRFQSKILDWFSRLDSPKMSRIDLAFDCFSDISPIPADSKKN